MANGAVNNFNMPLWAILEDQVLHVLSTVKSHAILFFSPDNPITKAP